MYVPRAPRGGGEPAEHPPLPGRAPAAGLGPGGGVPGKDFFAFLSH